MTLTKSLTKIKTQKRGEERREKAPRELSGLGPRLLSVLLEPAKKVPGLVLSSNTPVTTRIMTQMCQFAFFNVTLPIPLSRDVGDQRNEGP